MKKRILSALMGAVMCVGLCAGFCGCANGGNSASDINGSVENSGSASDSSSGNGSSANDSSTPANSGGSNTDWDYIANKGKLTVGITYNVPMNYLDDGGKLIGFETEFTTAVCEKLGVEPDFQLIEWSKKEFELNAKTIDLVWNGLTVTDERKENMLFSKSYMKNKQATVVKAENADKYPTTAEMADITIAFESGSAGEDIVKTDEALKNCKQVPNEAQKDSLLEVKSGTADACIIDFTMAKAATAEGTDFADLKVLENIQNTDEEYAVGARLGDTETIAKINAAIDELASEGKLLQIAKKYNLEDLLLIGAD